MNQFWEKCRRAWFPEAHPAGLAVLRMVVGGYACYYLWTRYGMMVRMAGARESLFQPVGPAALLESPLAPPVFEILLGLTLLLNVAFILGWGFRFSGPLFGAMLLWLLSYRNSWSMIYHAHNLLVLHVVILGFARSADAWSIDRLARWAATIGRPSRRWERWSPDGRYGWPLQLACLVTALTYFLAGVAKVAGPLGWCWGAGDALRSQVAVDALRKELLGDGAPHLAVLLYDHTWLFALMGTATLALELCAPLAAAGRRTSRWWAGMMFLFHWGIFLVMGIKFRYHLCGAAFAAFFIPRVAAASSPPRRRGRSARPSRGSREFDLCRT